MPRPPFDPSKAKGDPFLGGLFDPTPVRKDAATPAAELDKGAVAGAPPAPRELSVSEFSELIARTLDEGLRGSHRIAGEIANLSRRGHWYFTVKDARSVLSCVLWQSDAARVPFVPKEGDAVVVTGRIGHYPAQGRTQLYVSRMEPQGVGALELRFQQVVRELRELGYFDDGRKKPLPAHPRRVAVVTSAGGAALQDVIKTARERRAQVEFLVVDVRVQGEGAADEIARALRAIGRRAVGLGIDAVIVTRGGGSREDLWAFNERVVADAAFALPIPLVAAIGHEVDTSVIELVADRRASTPTQAAMLLLPDVAALAERLDRLARELRHGVRWAVSTRRDRLARLERSVAAASPALRIARARQRVDALARRLDDGAIGACGRRRRALEALVERFRRQMPAARIAAARAGFSALAPRLARAIVGRFADTRSELVVLERRLRAAGPQETLARGYAILTDANGRLVRSVASVGPGDRLDVEVADGRIGVRAESAVPGRAGASARTPPQGTT